MNCPKCNNVIEQGSSFCTACGYSLNAMSNQGQEVNVSNLEQPVMVNQNQAVSNVPTAQPMMINEVPVEQNVQTNMSAPSVNNVAVNNTVPNPAASTFPNMQPGFPNNNMMVNGNGAAAMKANNNATIIIVVVVIALVAVVACYFLFGRNSSVKSTNTGSTGSDSSVAVSNNYVTVEGFKGNVPNGWGFVSALEVGADAEAVFYNEEWTSYSSLMNAQLLFNDVKVNITGIKAQFEAMGLQDLDYKMDKKNGVEYVLFEGLYSGENYHILIRPNGAGVVMAEGIYSSADDLNVIVDFVTSLEQSTSVKATESSTITNLFTPSLVQ